MKRIALALAPLFIAGIASAADLPRKTEMPRKSVPAPIGMNWNGYYAGLQAGYAKGTASYNIHAASFTQSISGLFGGLRLGYDNQVGSFVYGVFGDVNYNNISGSANNVIIAGDYATARIRWSGDVNVRAGYLFTQSLLGYGFVGLNVSELRGNYSSPTVPYIVKNTSTAFAGNIGLGLEARLDNKWSIFGEYTYTKNNLMSLNKGTIGVNYRY